MKTPPFPWFRHVIAALLILKFLPASMLAQFPAATWERLSEDEARAARWSREKLVEAETFASTLKTEAVMIVTRGKVLAEWGPVDRKFNVHSIRKSFLSALCGIQAAAAKLSLDRTMAELGIDDCEPALSEQEKRATVRQLLQARSGIYHPALYETAAMRERRPARYSHEPGTFWYYNNWDFNALGTIYEQSAGGGIYEDLGRLIAEPIGMQDYQPADGKYVTGADSIHRAYPFRMSARDLARFGVLFLRSGEWQGRQVLPAAWVKESLTAYSEAGGRGSYGYMWWLTRGGVHLPRVTLPEGSFSARGAGGHYMLVIPPLDLVIVHRVNTDLDGQRVEASEFGALVQRILLAYEAPIPGKAAAAPLHGDAAAKALDTDMPLLMSKYHVPGVALIGLVNHRIAWERYYGVREEGKEARVDAETVFEVASMTKPLCAHAAMKLVEQGRLDLDAPLDRYLPEPYLKDQPLSGKITARMVLNHTTGFPNWRPKGQPLLVLHEPGTAYSYSGEGILFLQRVIEQITGSDYESHLQRTLLQPLGMKHSSHVWQPAFDATAAAGHDAGGQVKRDRPHYRRANAAYTLYCPPRDYAAFLLEMMNPDRSAPHSLSAASLQAIFTPASPPTGRALYVRQGRSGQGPVQFGLGWSIEPTATGIRMRHSGSNGTGFRSYCEFDPATGQGFVMVTNSTSGDRLIPAVVSTIGLP